MHGRTTYRLRLGPRIVLAWISSSQISSSGPPPLERPLLAHIANNFEVCSAPLFYAAKRPLGRLVGRFIIECLKRNRSIHRSFSDGRLPPPYQPVFATIDTYKASFPPSQSTYNLALRYFETNNAISSSIFLEKAASLGISKAEVPDVWIAILSIRDRLGAGAEDAIRNGSIPEDLVSTSVTGICLVNV